MTRRLLLLAGTREARKLALALSSDRNWHVTASLAGVTEDPAQLAADTRIGGFGGADGLTAYLADKGIDAVIDATHPFACQISANAAVACGRQQVPILRIERPPWTQPSGAQWICVKTLEAAAQALPSGARAFLTVGSNSLAPFARRDDVWFLVRALKLPEVMPFTHFATVVAPPASNTGEEAALMREHRISHLVAKNAGGPANAKLQAAAELDIPAIIVSRPRSPVGVTVANVEAAVEWLSGVSGTAG